MKGLARFSFIFFFFFTVSNGADFIAPQNPVAQLLDSGNLVVREAGDTNEDDYLWESFGYPGRVFLPGINFGKNLVTGLDTYLVSWKSNNDPSLGDSTTRLDPGGYPQIYIRVGENIVFRSGPWNGLRFSGMPNLKPNPIYTYGFVYNEKEICYRYDLTDSSVVSHMLLTNEGILQRFTWTNTTRTWNLAGEGFQKIPSVKLPDTRTSSFNYTMDLEECRRVCLMNCSCTAYSTLNITDGSGCLLWFEELLDIREYTENGQDFYIRLSASDLEPTSRPKRRTRVWIIAICTLVTGVTILGVCLLFLMRMRRKLKSAGKMVSMRERDVIDSTDNDLELPVFDFATIAIATSNFSEANKLGEEYAIDGLFSIKSDVFSFGVLVLEIVNGNRNRGFLHPDHKHNLLGHAWRLYKEQKSFELIDESLNNTCNLSEVLRVIHVGLLCVQQAPVDRPTMSTVVLMLTSNITLPEPKEPGFFTERKLYDQESSSSKVDTCSANEITITLLTAR
ncbi:hypothetical protein SADUNF_Sadunf16G0273000 [Salix dunnii]|uniref:Apple domain-containing protein n=1 Tax=Salix dunnii TaxID=1413687 RepID=A0A835MRE5_9ROSI|nr:hypothetical protein SADUNF_Sadunf16G0273000 [Salix dunnii]